MAKNCGAKKDVGTGWDIRILTQNFSEPGRWKLRNPRVKHMQQKNTLKSLKYSKGIMFQAKIIGFLGLSPILRQPNGPVVFDSYAFHHSLHKLLKSSSCVSSSAKHNDGSLKEVAVRSIWRFPKSWGYPNSWIVYNGKSFNKMDDFVVAPFLETSNFALEASVFFYKIGFQTITMFVL